MKPLLIVGIPRTGTTWVAQVCKAGAGCPLLHEPDNEGVTPLALWGKQTVGRFPWFPENATPPAPYRALWRAAMSGGRGFRIMQRAVGKTLRIEEQRAYDDANGRTWPPGPVDWLGFRKASPLSRVERARTWAGARLMQGPPSRGAAVLKTVHGLFALPWILRNHPASTVLVTRHPYAVAASMARLGNAFVEPHLLRDHGLQRALLGTARFDPDSVEDRWRRIGLQLALTQRFQRGLAGRDDVTVVSHEALCRDPLRGFTELGQRLGGLDPAAMARTLERLDRPPVDAGSFAPRRDTAAQAEAWRTALSDSERAAIDAAFAEVGEVIEDA
jgi:hypothetical protein